MLSSSLDPALAVLSRLAVDYQYNGTMTSIEISAEVLILYSDIGSGHMRASAAELLEWTFDPDPSDTTYTGDFVYMLREGDNPVRVEHDTHVLGLFSREEWVHWLQETGFTARRIEDPYEREVFVAAR